MSISGINPRYNPQIFNMPSGQQRDQLPSNKPIKVVPRIGYGYVTVIGGADTGVYHPAYGDVQHGYIDVARNVRIMPKRFGGY